jgi:hypothetical protein
MPRASSGRARRGWPSSRRAGRQEKALVDQSSCELRAKLRGAQSSGRPALSRYRRPQPKAPARRRRGGTEPPARRALAERELAALLAD